MDTDNSSKPTNTRRGNILVLAVIMLGAAMALIVQSSDSVSGTYQQISFKLREQKTLAAAEAVAASQEAALADLLATGDFQKVNTTTNNYGIQWFGDCQVKWKWEPAAVFEPKNPYDSATNYVVNPDPDPNAVIPSGAKQNNQDLYHYRIATEATLTENGVVRCRAQAVRVVQMTLSRLFRYAIFYGQRGARGDIEFAHGPTLNVAGSVHSNGAIYLAGSNGPNGSNIDSVQGGGTTNIGSAAKRVTVTAIDGVYRQSKRFNYYHQGGASYAGPDKNAPDPMLIVDPLLISGNNNRFINEISLTKDKDSLGDKNFEKNSVAGSPLGWGGYLRTAVTKATVVNSLANIPGFSGRPLEPQLLSNAAGILEWQRLIQFAVAATYTPGIGTLVTTTTPAAADLANAVNGPYLDFALGQRENGGSGRTNLTNIVATNSYDMHLEMTNSVSLAVSEVVPAIAGLIIRERPNGIPTAWNGMVWNGLVGNTPPPLPNSDTTAATYVAAKALYASYMASRYQVFLGRLDITNEFFAYPSPAQATAGRRFVSSAGKGICTVTEDFFYNPREYYSQGTKAWADTTIQRQSVLTLNMNAIQDFIRDITLANIASWTTAGGRDLLGNFYLFGATASGAPTGAVAPNTDTIRQHFSGLIYAHRTKRGGAYNAADKPEAFSNGVRVNFGNDISWNHNTGANPLGTSKLTIVTPNQVFLKGDFNTVLYPDAAGKSQQTPAALMCDMLTVQSNSFDDANQNTLATTPPSTSWRGASTTTYNVALVENNAPTTQAQRSDDASVHTFGWYMENWGGTTYNFKGSIVVLNSRRYCQGFNQGYPRQSTTGVDLPPDRTSPAPVLYGAPTRNITFNEDLMMASGTPPYSPFGTEVSRQVNYSYVVMTR